MKKMLIVTICLSILLTNELYSQSNTTELQSTCWCDTTRILIDSITEYSIISKTNEKKGIQIMLYLIKARYVEEKHNNYMTPLILVSIDTIHLQKINKSIYGINRVNSNHTIIEGHIYLFHLELYDCLPIVGGIKPPSFEVNGMHIPLNICPLQPYRAHNLKGLEYLPINTTI